MVLARREHGRRTFRVLVIGRKKLPETTGRSTPDERNWAMVVLTTNDLEELRRDLGAMRYVTASGDERLVAAAKPIGEGRYWLLVHDDHTELAYVLELPGKPGRVQREFNIKEEASYIASVKNPDISAAPGVPTPRQMPRYPSHVRKQFGDKRWIPADDAELLDYEYAQLLFLGSHEGKRVEETLGVHIDRKRETAKNAEVFTLLRLDRKTTPLEPLIEGKFPEDELPSRLEDLPTLRAPMRRRVEPYPRR
jgi:hypothetical protein